MSVTRVGSPGAPRGIVAPTMKQLKAAYRTAVDAAMRSERPPRAQWKAPAGWAVGKGVSLSTKPDNAQKVQVVKGTLWLELTGFVGRPQYFKIGPAPRF